ncbi:MAG: hypothetical protein IJN75_06885 [Clostridia bacterium]|nr:hypothetical protein [Clostridia bacterium]
MENYKFDKATREKLASLSSRELESVLGEIAEAIGADKMKTRMLLGNVEGVKGMLRTMTDDEANKLINSIGGEKADKILKDLKERY